MTTILKIGAALAVVVLLVACSDTTATPSDTAADPAAREAEPTSQWSIQTLTLAYDKPAMVGAEVRVSASNLPASKTVELTWATVTGGWVIEDYYHFRGKKYGDDHLARTSSRSTRSGRLDARFAIPEDYGGVHEVIALVDGKPVAQDGVEVTQTFEMTPTSGPVGTPIELKVNGLGWRTMESTWVVNWDNQTARLRAAGTRGIRGRAISRDRSGRRSHREAVYGLPGAGVPESRAVAESLPSATTVHLPDDTRDGFASRGLRGAVSAAADVRNLSSRSRVRSSQPTQGPVGTRRCSRGAACQRAGPLQLVWETYVGSRVSGDGYGPNERSLEMQPWFRRSNRFGDRRPDDLGGLHGLEMREGDRMLARAYFVVETSIVSMSPKSGPAGTPVTIHLKGVGWTEYDNILRGHLRQRVHGLRVRVQQPTATS